MDECKLKPIPSFPGYSITQDKRVWSEESQKWLSTYIGKFGTMSYVTVALRRDGHSRPVPIHRLLLETFVGPCPEGTECRHLDGNAMNNDLGNLCWGTRFENMVDRGPLRGDRNGNHKLTMWCVIWIKYLLTLQKFSQCTIAKLFGVSQARISWIKTGKSWVQV